MPNPRKAPRPSKAKNPLNQKLKGQRVQLHPATDDWMRGDRFGTIVTVGREFYTVRLDKSGKKKRFHPMNLNYA
jgi:hypothetical protein